MRYLVMAVLIGCGGTVPSVEDAASEPDAFLVSPPAEGDYLLGLDLHVQPEPLKFMAWVASGTITLRPLDKRNRPLPGVTATLMNPILFSTVTVPPEATFDGTPIRLDSLTLMIDAGFCGSASAEANGTEASGTFSAQPISGQFPILEWACN
jgi:hypothetical protein